MSIIEDREGLLWFGTANGISVLNKKRFRFPLIQPDPGRAKEGLAGGRRALPVRRSERHRLGWNGLGRARCLGTKDRFVDERHPQSRVFRPDDESPRPGDRRRRTTGAISGSGHRPVFTVIPGGPGPFRVFQDPARDPQALPYSSITAVLGGRPGFLWVGIERADSSNGISRPGRPGFFRTSWPADFRPPISTSCFVDRRGEVWAGTEGNGIIRFDPGTLRWSEYPHRSDDPRSLAANTVYAIAEDGSGRIWAGPIPALPVRRRQDDWIRLADDIGLPDRPVFAVVPDGLSGLLDELRRRTSSRFRANPGSGGSTVRRTASRAVDSALASVSDAGTGRSFSAAPPALTISSRVKSRTTPSSLRWP